MNVDSVWPDDHIVCSIMVIYNKDNIMTNLPKWVQNVAKYYIKVQNIWQMTLKFLQTGEISPNLVTLVWRRSKHNISQHSLTLRIKMSSLPWSSYAGDEQQY